MTDKSFSIGATTAAAWGLWALAVLGVVAGWVAGHQGLGQLGIVSGGAAATLHVRSFLCKQTMLMRAAYEVGREDGAGHCLKVKQLPTQRATRDPQDAGRR